MGPLFPSQVPLPLKYCFIFKCHYGFLFMYFRVRTVTTYSISRWVVAWSSLTSGTMFKSPMDQCSLVKHFKTRLYCSIFHNSQPLFSVHAHRKVVGSYEMGRSIFRLFISLIQSDQHYKYFWTLTKLEKGSKSCVPKYEVK